MIKRRTNVIRKIVLGPSNAGNACVARFKNIKSLAIRIMINKKKREANEDVVYSRFVLSSVRVKELLLDEPTKEKHSKKRTKSAMKKKSDIEEKDDYDMDDEQQEGTYIPKEDEEQEVEEEEEEEGEDDTKIKDKEEKNKVGY